MQYNNMIKILGIVTIALLLAPITISSKSQAVIDEEQCTKKILDSIITITKTDKSKPIIIAKNSNEFKSITEGYITTPRTPHFTYAIDKKNCNVELTTIEVGFIKSDSITKEKLNLVTVVMDPELNVKYVEDELVYAHSPNSYNWAGYSFTDDNYENVYQTMTTYTMPSVDKPTTPNSGDCRTDLGHPSCRLTI